MSHYDLATVPDEADRIAKDIIRINATGSFEDLRSEMTQRLLLTEFLSGDPESQLYRRLLAVAVMQNLAAAMQIMADALAGKPPADVLPGPGEPPC